MAKKDRPESKVTQERKRINAEMQELERRLKQRDGEDEWYKLQADHEQFRMRMDEMRMLRVEQIHRWGALAIKTTTATTTVCACGALFSYVLRDNADAGVVALCLVLFSSSMFALYAAKH